MNNDPWTVLGVRVGASAEEVRDAWRKRVSQWHPDRNRNPQATSRLQEINDAYACIRREAVAQPWPAFPDSVLAGLSGTVFGQPYRQADRVAPDCARASLEIPSASWLADQPITLGIPLVENFTTLVTILHPAQLRNGSVLVFPGAGLSALGTATDLLVTIRIVGAATEPPMAKRLQAQA